MAAVGLAGAIVYWVAQPQPLGLNVQATNSRAQVRIAWDKASRRVRNAKAGYLEIADGDQNVRVDLDANELHLGYVNYPRQSNNVTVRLVVEANDRTPDEDLARFVAPADQPPVVETAQSEPSDVRATGAAPDKAPDLKVPVLVETSDTAEPAKEHPTFQPPSPVVMKRHRAHKKPHDYSGSEPPFTCSVGDVFRKTDAAPGWDTFSCRGKNVWSITRTPDKL